MTMFDDSVFLQRTLRGRFREKDLTGVFFPAQLNEIELIFVRPHWSIFKRNIKARPWTISY